MIVSTHYQHNIAVGQGPVTADGIASPDTNMRTSKGDTATRRQVFTRNTSIILGREIAQCLPRYRDECVVERGQSATTGENEGQPVASPTTKGQARLATFCCAALLLHEPNTPVTYTNHLRFDN